MPWISNIESSVVTLLSEIRYIQNFHSPIHSLPDEILTVIIEMVASGAEIGSERESFEGIESRLSRLDCPIVRRVIFVCRRWHRIVVEDALLWSNIDVACTKSDGLKCMKRNLTRSQGVMLYLKVWSYICDTAIDPALETGLITAMRGHSDRVETLKITVSQRLGTASLIRELPFPQVKKLMIDLGDIRTTQNLIADAFPSGLPQLRELHLRQVTSWKPGLFANLIKLNLSVGPGPYDNSSRAGHMELTKFLEILQHSPMLEHINVAIHGPRSGGSDRLQIIPLLHLHTLHTRGIDARSILAHIRIPAFKEVDISGQYYSSLSPDIVRLNSLFSIIPRDHYAIGLQDIKSVHLMIEVGHTVELELFTGGGGKIHILESIPTYPGYNAQMLPVLLKSLHDHQIFSEVETFQVGYKRFERDLGFEFIEKARWGGALGCFPQLKHLFVHESVNENLLTVLGGAVLPQLLSLGLVIHESVSHSKRGIPTLESCIEMVRARKEAGVPLCVLRIRARVRSLKRPTKAFLQLKKRVLDLEGRDVEKIDFVEVGMCEFSCFHYLFIVCSL